MEVYRSNPPTKEFLEAIKYLKYKPKFNLNKTLRTHYE